ncbi:MAG: WD40 repeat domain-containing protein, partial [Candidatus Thermochlorobacter sp.]
MKPQLSLSLWLAFAFTHVVLHAQEVVEERAAVPKTPMLRIEIGMHTAPIKRISTDAQQDILVSASNDKTVRVWDLKTQRLLRVLRPPINLANDGMLYCAAISPDGKTVACGGWTGYDWDGDNYIYIFDPVTGKLLRRLKGPGGVINHLVFSQDGKYLAATAGGGFGLAVYRTTDYSVVAKDTDYNGGSYGADFGPSGILLTTCEDGYLRLYDDQFKLVAKHQTQCGKDPVHVAFSTDGAYIAIGFNDAPRVEVFDLKSKQLVKLG